MRNKIWEYIDNSQKIIILSHQRPDGDAVGSSLSLYSVLKNMGKDVDVVLEESSPVFSFLENYSCIKSNTNDFYDLAIAVDSSSKERIGQINDFSSIAKNTICIDHHLTNTNYCDINYVEAETSSCSQIIYYLLKEKGISITKEIGEAILLGVLTDTNGFSNNNVDADTLSLASDLVKNGIDLYKIYSLVLRQKTKSQYLLSKLASDRLEFFADGKIAFTYITKEDFLNLNANIGDHEGIVDIGRDIKGVEVSIFIREDDGYRFALRSNGKVSVNEIASLFGGGGHKMAAGGVLNTEFNDVKERLLVETKKRV